ncbi:hypothetical protein [Thiomicrorhabdus sp.]|uniref:hypothetical protein n=1 Tax=Thiomicrorhabdus sp. TaxID=2039724 RepID=UPI0029C70771|nr:hypothetical protein [Thiomicrorhabdus sp.]
MPDLSSIGSALLITFALLAAALVVVGLSMWWLYRVFKDKEPRSGSRHDDDQKS